MIQSQRSKKTARAFTASESHVSQQYWDKAVDRLPAGPCLPAAPQGRTGMRAATFVEHHHLVLAADCETLSERASALGLSVNAVLLAVYLEVLARWSGKAAVCVRTRIADGDASQTPVDDRIDEAAEIPAIDLDPMARTFTARAAAVQSALAAALLHRACDNTDVLHRWSLLHDLHDSTGAPPLPYRFTGRAAPPRSPDMADAPLWLDAQAHLHDGALHLTWYELSDIFDPEAVAQAFATFTHAVDALCQTESAWERDELPLAPQILERLDAANRTATTWPAVTLHEGLFGLAADPATAQQPAFIAGERSLSFVDLACQATQLAAYLNENGVGPSDHVVVRGRPSFERVVAIYAVLIAGATYVPVPTSFPLSWAHAINRLAATTTVIGDDDGDIERAISSPVIWSLNYAEFLRELPGDCAFIPPAYLVPPSQCAYIMFGDSTAELERGVAVSHAAAINTLQDCLARFAIQPTDRLLAISEPAIDRSVFDLFMPALTGCAAVLPVNGDGAPPGPGLWLDSATASLATVWNSTPTQMAQALDEACNRGSALPSSLRLWLASGVRVPPSLPGRIGEQLPQARLVLLGGAPEVAAWATFAEPAGIGEGSTAGPRSMPMSNMRVYVLDECSRRCPPGVVGTLHLTGAGLALGHVKGSEFKAEAFIVDARLGERLFRTGHRVICASNGAVELLACATERSAHGGSSQAAARSGATHFTITDRVGIA